MRLQRVRHNERLTHRNQCTNIQKLSNPTYLSLYIMNHLWINSWLFYLLYWCIFCFSASLWLTSYFKFSCCFKKTSIISTKFIFLSSFLNSFDSSFKGVSILSLKMQINLFILMFKNFHRGFYWKGNKIAIITWVGKVFLIPFFLSQQHWSL